jgi:hypothetical protein
MTTSRGEKHHAEPRRRITPYLARYGLLISLAAVSLTSSIVSARTDDSPSLPSPSATPTTDQTTIDQCRQQYSALRQDVDAKAQPIRDARDVRVPASTLCKLVTIYEEAELRMISFIEANSSKCRIPDEIGKNVRDTHLTTEKIKGEACKTPELRWRE